MLVKVKDAGKGEWKSDVFCVLLCSQACSAEAYDREGTLKMRQSGPLILPYKTQTQVTEWMDTVSLCILCLLSLQMSITQSLHMSNISGSVLYM